MLFNLFINNVRDCVILEIKAFEIGTLARYHSCHTMWFSQISSCLLSASKLQIGTYAK